MNKPNTMLKSTKYQINGEKIGRIYGRDRSITNKINNKNYK